MPEEDSTVSTALTDFELQILKDLRERNLSDKERQLLLEQLKRPDAAPTTHEHYISNTHARFIVISDSHIGHKEFKPEILEKAFSYAKHKKVDAIYHVGDITEGMSGRPGHIYELTHIGVTDQLNYTADLFKQSPVGIYGITGNHDQWAYKNVGVDVGKSLEEKVEQFHYLGQNEADVKLTKDITMKLFHPNDGSSYATSYKLQKLIESFTGGEKPHIVLEGHYHKAMYAFMRNVHGFESGTLMDQSSWMRGKKLAAHMGFWMIDVYYKKDGTEIQSIVPQFVPHYEK